MRASRKVSVVIAEVESFSTEKHLVEREAAKSSSMPATVMS